MIDPIKIYRTWRTRARLLDRMGIGPDDLVLDVASGQNPNPRANVLCERYVDDSTERTQESVIIDRPFVVGDVFELPFRAQAFDYVICSQLLEHLEDPSAAIAELQRVATRGYVETPSAVNEKVASFPFHLWYIREEDGVMVFREKPEPIHDAELRDWFKRLVDHYPTFYDFYFKNLHEIGNIVAIVWEGELKHRVERLQASERPGFVSANSPDPHAEFSAVEAVLQRTARAGWRSRANSALARWGRMRSDRRLDLDDLLACPRCKTAVERVSGGLECASCERRYPVARAGGRSVPFLVAVRRSVEWAHERKREPASG